MKVSLKSITPNSEGNIVEIARVSSSRKDKSEAPEGLINYLIKNKHWSPFEHSYLTFEIVTSKVIAIQFLRHVSFRFQDFSRRYAKVHNIEPIEFRLQAETNRQSSTVAIGHIDGNFNLDFLADNKYGELFTKVADHLRETYNLYDELLNVGVARECASMILPLAMQTTLFMTGNIRSWIHLLEVRDDGHAQKEAQLIAKEIKKIFTYELPIISKALNFKD
jgi:thymidylate synthase (FAD)